MEHFKPFVQIVILSFSLCQVLLINSVESCNSQYRYGHGGVDYSYYSGMDASQHPTLSEKIRGVVKSHYGYWPPSKTVTKGLGGVSYSHNSGHGHNGYVHTSHHSHSHSNFESDNHQPHHHHQHTNSWAGSSEGGHKGPGYEYAAHNQPKPAVTVADKSDLQKRGLVKKLRKVKVTREEMARGSEGGNEVPVRS